MSYMAMSHPSRFSLINEIISSRNMFLRKQESNLLPGPDVCPSKCPWAELQSQACSAMQTEPLAALKDFVIAAGEITQLGETKEQHGSRRVRGSEGRSPSGPEDNKPSAQHVKRGSEPWWEETRRGEKPAFVTSLITEPLFVLFRRATAETRPVPEEQPSWPPPPQDITLRQHSLWFHCCEHWPQSERDNHWTMVFTSEYQYSILNYILMICKHGEV